MPKKKPPRNAFFFFMLDYKARCERNGERFPNGLRDVQAEASPEWNAMPREAKQIYEDMAREEKAKIRGNDYRGNDYRGNDQKQTCMNNSYGIIEEKRRTAEDFKAQANHFIESTVTSLANRKALADYKFYLIHVNYFCVSVGDCYHPAELAICEFSLGEGVTDVYHTLIDPGQLPLGYRMEAIDKSDSTHKIPVDDNEGEKNFYKILTDIQKFIQPGRSALDGECPPMFTMPDNVNINTSIKAVRSVMDTLSSSDSFDNEEKFRIYPIEKLFLELRNACCRQSGEDGQLIPNISVAIMELEKDVFCFTQNIACEFHRERDAVEFCSKSYVQRWVYLICDHCCQFLNITIIPGRHLPENSDTSYSENQKLREQEEAASKPTDSAWNQTKSERKPWAPVEQPPLPRPNKQANLAAMLPTQSENLDFPSLPSVNLGRNTFDSNIVIGRGRSQNSSRGGMGAWGKRRGNAS